ncbi:hypothetical protein DAEQUDRAFT_761935 [Daedalea quercina L-15889]|uniref:Uncharacterized protein n=1 Tax=Daedalea quercina L-15889 TaxID=1314783 RepID=A0A165THW9_9APHY|nr:hypothetical protein DAEQUDRAFT_761935 [Daedalea quercina L-15889]
MGNSYSVAQQLSREEWEEHDYAQLVEAVEAAQLQSGQYQNVQALHNLPGPYIPDAFQQSSRLNHLPGQTVYAAPVMRRPIPVRATASDDSHTAVATPADVQANGLPAGDSGGVVQAGTTVVIQSPSSQMHLPASQAPVMPGSIRMDGYYDYYERGRSRQRRYASRSPTPFSVYERGNPSAEEKAWTAAAAPTPASVPPVPQGPFPPRFIPQAGVHAEPPANLDIRRDQTPSPDYPPVIPPTPPLAMPQFRIESQAEISSYPDPSHASNEEDAVNPPSSFESQRASYASEESESEERPIVIPPPAPARPTVFYARPLSITGTTTPGKQSLPQRRPLRPRIFVQHHQSASPSASSIGSESGNAAPLPAFVHVPQPQNRSESPRHSCAPHTAIASPVPQPPIIVQPPAQFIAAQQPIMIMPTQPQPQMITVQPNSPPPSPPQWAEDLEFQRPTEDIIIRAEPSERTPSIQSCRLRRAPSDASDAPIIIQPATGGQLAVQPAELTFVRSPILQESVSEIVIRSETLPERRRTRSPPGEEYARPRSRSPRVYDREDRCSRSPPYDNRAQYPDQREERYGTPSAARTRRFSRSRHREDFYETLGLYKIPVQVSVASHMHDPR